MSGQAKDGNDEKTSMNLPASSDCRGDELNEMMNLMWQRLEKLDKELKEQKKNCDDMEKCLKDTKEELNRVKTEQAVNKLNFENTYGQLGGETIFYLDLDSLRDIVLEQIGDDEAAKEKFEVWYKMKKWRKLMRIGVGFLIGGVGGAVIGVLCGGIVLVAIANGLVLCGSCLGAYKLYCMYKCKQIKKAHEAKNNDAQSEGAENTKNEEAHTESNDVPIWEMLTNEAMLS